MKLLKSKKFQMAVAGLIVVIISHFIPDIDPIELKNVVYLIVAYIIGQGLADFGKEAN